MLAARTAPSKGLRHVTCSTRTARLQVHAVAGEMEGKGRGKVLVLGGTGFVGSAVCEKLLNASFEVVSVSRRGPPVSDKGW